MVWLEQYQAHILSWQAEAVHPATYAHAGGIFRWLCYLLIICFKKLIRLPGYKFKPVPNNRHNQTYNYSEMSELNDPRVLFSAERTLLAWNRTSISLMAFGFVVERFGLFLEIMGKEDIQFLQRHLSFVVGLCFILLATFIALYSIVAFRRVVTTLKPTEIPVGYNPRIGIATNAIVGFLGLLLSIYLLHGFL